MDVEGGPHRLELKAQHLGIGLLASQQVHQERGDQGAVHDEAGVALHLGDVLAVVVNAVTVEGEGRVAKQQHIVGHDAPLPGPLSGRGLRWRSHIIRPGGCAVNDVVVLGERHFIVAIAPQLMPHFHKDQAAGTARLFFHIDDGGGAAERIANPQRFMEFKVAPGPHAARQGHGRHEATALGMTVGANVRLRIDRQKVQPVPQVGQRCAGRRALKIGLIERGRQGRIRGGGGDVFDCLNTANPVLQVHGHFS